MKTKTDKSLPIRSAILLMAAVAVARGTSFIFFKQLLAGGMEPFNLLGVRSLIAFAVLMAFFGRRVIASVGCNHHNLTAGMLLGFVYFLIMTLELNGLRYTTAIIITDREAKKYDPFVIGILYVGFMGIFGMAGSFVTETPHLPQTWSQWLLMLMLAVICSSFGFAMQPVAQKVISAETAGILTALNPLTTTVLGIAVLRETFGLSDIIGAILILGGIILHSKDKHGDRL